MLLGYLVSSLLCYCLWRCGCCRAPGSVLLTLQLIYIHWLLSVAQALLKEVGEVPILDGTRSHTFLQSPGLHFTPLDNCLCKGRQTPEVVDAVFHCQLPLALTYSPLTMDTLEEDRDEDKLVP